MPSHRQEDAHGLRLCDAVQRRQDQPHDEDLAFGLGHEGARLGLNIYRTYPLARSAYGQTLHRCAVTSAVRSDLWSLTDHPLLWQRYARDVCSVTLRQPPGDRRVTQN